MIIKIVLKNLSKISQNVVIFFRVKRKTIQDITMLGCFISTVLLAQSIAQSGRFFQADGVELPCSGLFKEFGLDFKLVEWN